MKKVTCSLRKHITTCFLMVITVLTVSCGTLEVGIEPDGKGEAAKAQTAKVAPAQQLTADPRQQTPTMVPEDYTPPTPEPALTPVAPGAYPAPAGLRVAFIKEGDVWLWAAKQKAAVPLTTGGEAVGDIRMSEDGAIVAFRRGEDGELWTVNSDGTGERPVVSIDDLEAEESGTVEARLHQFAWVPGTHILAFNTRLRREAGDIPADDLHLVDADTLEQTLLLPSGEGGEFHYSPDGSQIAIVTVGDISLMDADGMNRRDGVLTYAPVAMYISDGYYVRPIWAADGRSLLVAVPPANPHALPTQHTTIWRITTDGTSANLVTSVRALPDEGSVTFSQELNFMAYAEVPELHSGATPPTEASAQLSVIRLENGDWFGHPSIGGLYGWAPNSRRFAFLADPGDQTQQLQIGQWSGRGTPGIVDAGVPVHDLRWVDSDHYLVLVGRGQERYDLLLGDVSRGSTVLTSVESSWLAYDFANGATTVPDSAPTTTLAPTSPPLAKPTSTPAGESSTLRVIFIKEANVWMWTEEFGPVTLTPSGNVIGAKISDDGGVVAYIRQLDEEHTELWAVNTDGSDARRLVSTDGLLTIDPSALAVVIHEFDWVPGRHTLAFNTREVIEGPGLMPYDDLWLVDVDSLQQTALLPPGEGGSFHFSSDGSQIAIVSPQNISLMAGEGGDQREVLAYPPVATYSEHRFYAHPVWAPDSRSLLVAIPPADPLAQPSEPTTIWYIPTDGTPASLRSRIDAQPLRSDPAFSWGLSRVAYLGLSASTPVAAGGGPLMLTDLRTNETVTYHAQVQGIYGWAPNSESFAFRGDGERSSAYIGQVDGVPWLAAADEYSVVADLRWVDADRYVFSAYLEGRGWDIVLAEIGDDSTVLSDVGGRPPVFDLTLAAVQQDGDGVAPSSATSSPRTYRNRHFAMELQYPREWKLVPEYGDAQSGERFAGSDGFFMVNAIGNPTASIDEVAAQEARHKLQPYGSRPEIENLRAGGQEARLILPSADANMEGQAALVVEYPRPVSISGTAYQFFVLYADQDHIRTIGQSLSFEGWLATSDEGPPLSPGVWQKLPPGLVYRTSEALWQVGVKEQPAKVSTIPGAVLSPDGTRLVSHDGVTGDLWLVNLSEGTQQNLVQTPDRVECCLRWWAERPDVLLFNSEEKDTEPSPGLMGYLTAAGVDGQEWRILDEAHDTGPGQFSPSPDGRTIAYGGGSTGWLYHWESGPEVFDPADYGMTGTKGIRIGSPAWSPDGEKLAWVVGGGLGPDGDWRLATGVFNLAAGTHQLIHDYVPAGRGGWPSAPAWSPDGEWLALTTWDEGAKAPGLWAVRYGTTEEEYELGRGDGLVWSPDGRWLAFNGAKPSGETEILVAQTESWEIQALALPGQPRLVGWSSPTER